MSRRAFVRVVTFSTLALLAALSSHCSDGSDTETADAGVAGTDSDAVARDFCERYAMVTCEVAEDCACLVDTFDGCKARQFGFCWEDIGRGLSLGRLKLDEAVAETCLAQVAKLWGTCTPSRDPWPDACGDMLVAVRVEGDSCSHDRECVSPLSCWDDVCTRPPEGGELCFGGLCAVGFYCTADERCEPLGIAGEDCPEEHYGCAPGYHCEPSTMECKPNVSIGDPCGDADDACGAGAYCSATSGTCQALPFVGDSCTDSQGDCSGDAYCDESSVCRARLERGETCAADEACQSLLCVDDVCVAEVGDVCGG